MRSTLRILAWPAFKKPTLRPYNTLLYRSMQELGATVDEFNAWRVFSRRYDIVHLHWPEYCVNERGALASLFWSCALFGAMCWVRLRGGHVVWTVHNLDSHVQQHPVLERHFWRIFTALLNAYISLTRMGREAARNRHPALRKLPGFVIPHGNLRSAYPQVTISPEQARARLGIAPSAKVLAFVGAVAPYKGVTELAEAFSVLPDSNAVLVVAGRCCLPLQERKRLEEIAHADPRILLRVEYIPHDDVPWYIRAADLVVLPFRHILNSGSAILTLSLDKPVLVPAKGSMKELEEFAGSDWVRLYSGELSPGVLQTELDTVIACAARRSRCRSLENGWAGLEWRDLAQLTLDAYRSTVQAASHSGAVSADVAVR